jgi:AraC-like DNA-binding protein
MLILNIITFCNLLFLFCLLFFRKNNVLPNKVLALILINPGINFLSNINVLSGNFHNSPYFYFFAQVNCFAFAPLVWYYVNLFIGKTASIKHPLFIVTALCVALTVYFAIDFAYLPESAQANYLNGILKEPYPWQMNVVNGLFILMQQVYFTTAAINIYRYRKKLSNTLSNYDKTQLTYITKFLSLIWTLNIITIALYATLPTIQVEYIYLPLVLTAIYFFILYYSIHYHSIFTPASYATLRKSNMLPNFAENQNDFSQQIIVDAELAVLSQQIEDFLTTEEPFTNPDLTLEILANQLDIPVAKLSLAINKVLKKTFYELINEKRIQKSKILLRSLSDQNTIEYVAYESGFNSRASFYRAFKKHTDTTPTAYLKAEIQE